MPSSLLSNNPIFIRAQINNVYRQVILDTGSGTTIIHHRFLKQIQHNGFRPIPSSYSSANCTTLVILGEVDLNIKINNILTTITAAVATCLVTDLLLGTDWINMYVNSLDIINQTLNIHDANGQCTTTPLIRSFNSSTSSPVTLMNSVTIPKYSTCTVSVKIPSINNTAACFELSSQLNTKLFFIPDALINIKTINLSYRLPMIPIIHTLYHKTPVSEPSRLCRLSVLCALQFLLLFIRHLMHPILFRAQHMHVTFVMMPF